MDCLICFCTIEGPHIGCCDPQCLAGTCLDCGVALIAYSSQNNLMPTCPSKNCKGFYLISEIKKLSEPSISLYEKTCLQHVLKDKGDTVSITMAHQEMVSKLRQERSIFISQNFPMAISHVAQIAFKPRLSHLNRTKTQNLATKLKTANRLCMNLYCNGRLDESFACMTCLTGFCTKCEQPTVTAPPHTCKQEDIESVQMIKKMIQCPNCKYPVEKSEGCNSMTCTNCHTNFDYSTGQLGGHGNTHNASIAVREKYKLSVLLSKDISPEVLNMILQIESYEPTYSDKSLLNSVKAHYLLVKPNGPNTNEEKIEERAIAKKITKQFEDMTLYKYRVKLYLSIHKEIESLHNQKALTVLELTKLLNKLLNQSLMVKSSAVAAIPTIPTVPTIPTIPTIPTVPVVAGTTDAPVGPIKFKIKKIISKVI